MARPAERPGRPRPLVLILATVGALVVVAAVLVATLSSRGGKSPKARASGPTTTTLTPAERRAQNGRQAATVHRWGPVVAGDEFNGDRVSTRDWYVYDGPGNAGNGRRLPDQVHEGGGLLTIDGLADGDTGGIAWRGGQRYGRWEIRMRVHFDRSHDAPYHAVLLLWPDSNKWPSGGEIDFVEAEVGAPNYWAHVHYPNGTADGSETNAVHSINLTRWHDYAVQWTPTGITTYVDGRAWYTMSDRRLLPPGPMHPCIQLDDDYHGAVLDKAVLQVNWIRQYRLAG